MFWPGLYNVFPIKKLRFLYIDDGGGGHGDVNSSLSYKWSELLSR